MDPATSASSANASAKDVPGEEEFNEEEFKAAVKIIHNQQPQLSTNGICAKIAREYRWRYTKTESWVKKFVDFLDDPALNPVELRSRDATYDQNVKNFFKDYTEMEREFILSFSEIECKSLAPLPPEAMKSNLQSRRLHLAQQERLNVKLLFTLKGISTCTWIYRGGKLALFITDRLIREVLQPLMTKHALDLYGFTLRFVSQPTTLEGVDNWRGGWVFGDAVSRHWPLAENTFLPTSPLVVSEEDLYTHENQMSMLEGSPTQWPMYEDEKRTLTYFDSTEKETVQNLSVWAECFETGRDRKQHDWRVKAVSYVVVDGNEETWMKCILHIKNCKKAMKEVGSKMTMNLAGHPKLNAAWEQDKEQRKDGKK